MKEIDKMRNGEWYDANFDPEQVKTRMKLEVLCNKFNQAEPGSEEQLSLLKEILQDDLPKNFGIFSPAYFDFGFLTHFGEGTQVNRGCYFMDGGEITIGKNVFIGPFCGFYTATHPMTYEERNKGLERALPIKVGDNCWFGGNVVVLAGVTIGPGCVIAAGSVVTKDIPANSVVAGVPAVVKKTKEK